MKIAIVNASAASGMDSLMKTVVDTLSELGEEIVNIKLDKIKAPFWSCMSKGDETALQTVHDAIYEVMSAEGVIFITPAVLGGTSALMRAFLEHFSPPQFSQGLTDKNCMVVTSGMRGGERGAFEDMSRVIGLLGGYDAVRINVPNSIVRNGLDDDGRRIVEKQTEDFYRILRQGRKFFNIDTRHTDNEPKETIGTGKEHRVAQEELERFRAMRERADNQPFTETQKEEISEIARIIGTRFENSPAASKVPEVLKPRNKTCRQMTASLPHYYNPQLAVGFQMALALNVTGDEVFTGKLSADSSGCVFTENAVLDGSDVFVTVDARVWRDILSGKYTAQKAFMVGNLKVRGNFLLLTKFDQLFSKMDM